MQKSLKILTLRADKRYVTTGDQMSKPHVTLAFVTYNDSKGCPVRVEDEATIVFEGDGVAELIRSGHAAFDSCSEIWPGVALSLDICCAESE